MHPTMNPLLRLGSLLRPLLPIIVALGLTATVALAAAQAQPRAPYSLCESRGSAVTTATTASARLTRRPDARLQAREHGARLERWNLARAQEAMAAVLLEKAAATPWWARAAIERAALGALRCALRLSPGPRAHALLAEHHRARSDYAAAAAHLRAALRLATDPLERYRFAFQAKRLALAAHLTTQARKQTGWLAFQLEIRAAERARFVKILAWHRAMQLLAARLAAALRGARARGSATLAASCLEAKLDRLHAVLWAYERAFARYLSSFRGTATANKSRQVRAARQALWLLARHAERIHAESAACSEVARTDPVVTAGR